VLEGAKLPDRTGSASVKGGRLLPSASGPSYLDPVSLKIVFNGAEYDSVEAMPPDVRAQYNEVLESLKKTGGDEVLSALQRVSSGTGGLSETIMTTHRETSSGASRRPPPPPVIEDDQPRQGGGGVLRILMWMALGAAIAWWLLRR